MSGDGRSFHIDQILEAIDFGQLTYNETERRLQQIIDSEVSQMERPADADLLDSCYSLMLELHTHGSLSFDSNKEKNWQAVQQRIRVNHTNPDMWHKVVISAAAALILICMGGVLLHGYWFEGASTPDNQQYFVQGHEISTEMVTEALAGHDTFAQYEGNNLDDLKTYLGFQPAIPQHLTNGLIATKYSVFFSTEIQLSISYALSPDSPCSISYNTFYYSDMDNAYISMEQSESGESEEICGYRVYITSNLEHQLACWQIGNAVHILSFNVPIENVKTIIAEFIGGTYK